MVEVTSRIRFWIIGIDFRLASYWFWISLVIIFRYGKIFFFFTSLNYDFSFSLTLYKTWNEDWKLIATMIYILYTWKISIIYIIIIFYLSLSQRYEAIYIEARNNFLSSENRSPHDRFDDSIRATASILSDTWYDSTFERLP